ncbi:MAG: glycosyltransferase [Anaerolineales bacterium]|jgi:glycosyltransferase involved in cell wall biosynthesis|nr:glycosyltransferase [Anaerolineales bacterium]GER80058.1 conserved hypothetical protein [Candidatus Denitrolinea symbiosum]
MKNIPVVSVIMPTYNHAKYLRRSIDSVLAQTFPAWELVIWNDGSIDETENVVRSYQDKRIKYFFDGNHGVAYARNRAIEYSLGEYLAFLDSDDEWGAKKLADQVEIMSSYPQLDVLFGDFLNIDLNTNLKESGFEQTSKGVKLLNVEQIAGNLFFIKSGMPESLVVSNFICPSSVLMRREILEKVGFFNEALNGPEDFELWWRLSLADAHFAYISRICVTRYKLLGSLSSPNISTYENKIKALDYSFQATMIVKREKLISSLKRSYKRTWQNLIPLYGKNGNAKRMIWAFVQSIKYGIDLYSVRLLFESVENLIKFNRGLR